MVHLLSQVLHLVVCAFHNTPSFRLWSDTSKYCMAGVLSLVLHKCVRLHCWELLLFQKWSFVGSVPPCLKHWFIHCLPSLHILTAVSVICNMPTYPRFEITAPHIRDCTTHYRITLCNHCTCRFVAFQEKQHQPARQTDEISIWQTGEDTHQSMDHFPQQKHWTMSENTSQETGFDKILKTSRKTLEEAH
jgi:hypothetical protein